MLASQIEIRNQTNNRNSYTKSHPTRVQFQAVCKSVYDEKQAFVASGQEKQHDLVLITSKSTMHKTL